MYSYETINQQFRLPSLATKVLSSCFASVSMVYLQIICVFYYVCTHVLHTLVAGFLAWSQYSEGPATGHLGTGFSWFPCIYKRMLRCFPILQVATACFSCSPPDLNFLDPYFVFMYMPLTTAKGRQPICSYIYYYCISLSPLFRIAIHIFLRQTMSLGDTLLQLFSFCCYGASVSSSCVGSVVLLR